MESPSLQELVLIAQASAFAQRAHEDQTSSRIRALSAEALASASHGQSWRDNGMYQLSHLVPQILGRAWRQGDVVYTERSMPEGGLESTVELPSLPICSAHGYTGEVKDTEQEAQHSAALRALAWLAGFQQEGCEQDQIDDQRSIVFITFAADSDRLLLWQLCHRIERVVRVNLHPERPFGFLILQDAAAAKKLVAERSLQLMDGSRLQVRRHKEPPQAANAENGGKAAAAEVKDQSGTSSRKPKPMNPKTQLAACLSKRLDRYLLEGDVLYRVEEISPGFVCRVILPALSTGFTGDVQGTKEGAQQSAARCALYGLATLQEEGGEKGAAPAASAAESKTSAPACGERCEGKTVCQSSSTCLACSKASDTESLPSSSGSAKTLEASEPSSAAKWLEEAVVSRSNRWS